VSEQPPEPISLERARLLLGWLRAQRAVDICLSELLAAGPAGERRVSGQIDRVSDLVAAATAAFEDYRGWVLEDRGGAGVASRASAVDTELRSISLEEAAPINR
jgi:hypothetical protein